MSKTRRTRLFSPLLLAVLTTPGHADDSKLVTLLQLDIAEKKIEHTFTEAAGNVQFGGYVSSAIYGAGIAKGRFTVSASFEQPLKTDTSYQANTGTFTNLSRNDRSLTFGYMLNSWANVFVGYKRGETQSSGLGRDSMSFPSTVAPNALDFIETGPFIGCNLNYEVNDDNTLGLNIAYADMDGEMVNKINYAGGGGTGPGSATGTADGLSVGIKWSHVLTPQAYLNIGLKLNQYETTATDVNGTKIQFDSDYTYLTVGVSYLM
ncbi:MAG: hypothetical protein OEY67_02440 [Gammaproteobacteria bacterium]|nr:hypothetical protein [Gammaproteobacteria bacterium]